MSGNDTGGAAVSWDTSSGDDDCARVVVADVLDPSDPEELFVVGAEYDVVLLTVGSTESVQVVNQDGQAVGTVRPHAALVRCLRNNVLFSALVTSVVGAAVEVRIRTRT